MKGRCMEYFERISEYLDGELDADLCKKIEAHLDECPECRECVGSLKRTIHLCREGGQERIPAAVLSRLKSNLHDCLKKDRV
jgi:anti-sigma factor (TIGR02949 family)